MKKKMKLKKVVVMLLSAFMMLSTFVACNANIEDAIMEPATVNFAPAMYKALNQDGTAQEVTGEDVNNYHWKYWYGKEDPRDVPEQDLIFSDFDDQLNDPTATGLGSIRNKLVKGESYFFALRGYSTTTDSLNPYELMWEGKTDKATKITSKNTMVTISVTPKGKGDLYFNITAPAYDAESYVSATNVDYFRVKITDLNGHQISRPSISESRFNPPTLISYPADSGDFWFETVYTSDTQMISYVSSATDFISLPAGTYMMTISQMRYDETNLNTGSMAGPGYVEVENRGQFLLFTIEPKVDTVIRGSLDSSTIEVLKDYTGLNVIEFLKGDDSKIKSLDVQVKNSEGNTKMIGPDNRINVADKDYVRFTSISDGYEVYWNTYSVTSPTSGYTVTTSTDNRYVVNVNGTSKPLNTNIETSGTDIIAHAEADKSYIITIKQGDYSVSFTIVGLGDEATKKAFSVPVALSVLTANPIQKLGNDGDNVTASVPVSEALKTSLTDMFNGMKSGDQKVSLSVGVAEVDKTDTTLKLDISLNASAEVYSGNNLIESKSQEIHDLGGFATVEVMIEKNLAISKILHGDAEMTSCSDIDADAFKNYSDSAGAYVYEPSTGKLTIRTKSFSPFTLTIAEPVAQMGYRKFSTLQAAIDAARDGETIKLLTDIVTKDRVNVDKTVVLDLAGKTISAASGFSPKNSGVIGVKRGGNLTIDDTSSGKEGKISSNDVYAAVSMTILGESTATDAAYAKLTVNAGTLEGLYYGIVGNGNRHNTKVVINGGTVKGTNSNDNTGIYNPQNGTLEINGGTIEGAMGIYVKAGTVSVVSGGTVRGTGPRGTYEPSGDGIKNCTGDAFIVDNCGYPGGVPNVSISGGTFVSTNGEAIGSYAYNKTSSTNYAPLTGFIKGGTFSSDPSTYVDGGHTVTKSGNVWVVTEKPTNGK